jgi:hypothetical protein
MPVAWVWLPATALFTLPLADTHSALSSVTLRWDEGFGVDATLAADFPVLALQAGAVEADVGIEAGVWMGFDPNEDLQFDLETVDGTFAVPFSVRSGPWSGRIEVAHTSAHFADGVRDNGVLPASTEGYSREWLSLVGSRAFGPARVYVGGKGLIHDQRGAAPFAAQAGAELVAPWVVAPFAAVDVQMAGESDWAPALGAQLGVLAVPHAGERLRVALAGRTGPEDTGKLTGRQEAWIGVVFGFDRTGRVASSP